MHWLGKTFAALVVVAAIVAASLSAKLVQVRNSYTAKVAASRAKYQDLESKIDQTSTKIDTLRNELFRVKELWGDPASNVQTNVNPADGTVEVAIGDKVFRPEMVVYGFELRPDGTSLYRGSFLVSNTQPQNSILKPNFRVAPNEAQAWHSGPWRWRNAIPSGYQTTFDKLLLDLVKAEETLKARKMLLEEQKKLLADSNNGLKLREAELVGGEQLDKGGNVDSEYREGVVAAVEQLEEERNQILLKNDQLRHVVKQIQAEIERLQAENIGLVEQLPSVRQPDAVTQTGSR